MDERSGSAPGSDTPDEEPAASGLTSSGWPQFRERVQSHPVAIVFGFVVAAITATLGVALPVLQLTRDNDLAAQQANFAIERSAYESKVADLSQSLSSIHLALGSDADYLDVGKVVIARDHVADVPAAAVAYPDDHFFAVGDGGAAGWAHSTTTELHLIAIALGVSDDEAAAQLNLAPEQVAILEKFPVHLWSLGADRVIKFDTPGADTPSELDLPTQIVVQRAGNKQLEEALVAQLGASIDPASVRIQFQLDPTGGVLQRELLSEGLGSSTGLLLIDSLQKKGSTAYAKLETVLFNVSVDGQQFDRYYLDRDVLIISTSNDTYIVKRSVADANHRSPDLAALAQWLDVFRVCSDC